MQEYAEKQKKNLIHTIIVIKNARQSKDANELLSITKHQTLHYPSEPLLHGRDKQKCILSMLDNVLI